MTDILVYTEEQGNVIAGSVQPDRMVVAVLGAVGGGTGGGGAVSSVNGQIGHVVLDAADVGADPAGTGASAAAAAVAAHEAALDPHPQYTTAAEAAAAAPVQSVNGEMGAVVLSATDVGADAAGTAAAAVVAHEAALDPHPQYLTQTEGDARYERGLTAGTNVTIDRTDPDNPIISAVGGGGGAVDSVNGQTGVVVLDTDDVAEGATNLYHTPARAAAAAPVQSVNGQTGAVNLSGSYAPLSHVGAGGTAHATVVAGGDAGFMSGADKTKLDGIAPWATANATDAQLRDRSTHTGTQTASTISDFSSVARAQVEAELVAGTNVTITPSGSGATRQLTIAASSGASLAQVVEYTGAAKTLALTDINTVIDCTSSSAVTITIPPQSSVTWTADAEIHVRMSGTGTVSIAVGSGVTIPPLAAPIALSGQGAMITLKRRSSDVWALVGSVVGGPDVVGPASSVDNEISRFDGATGKKLKAGLKYQTSKSDATAGALMIVGAGGLLENATPATTDLDALTHTQFIREAGATGSPAGGATTMGLHIVGANSDVALQFLGRQTADRLWWRRKNVTFASWLELFHSAAACLLTVDTASLGFGTGSGGTVTQATSKTTAVTLNKPSGRITMNNAALAAGASVLFNVLNSTVSSTDCVVCNVGGNFPNYRVETVNVGAGAFNIRVTNVSAGSLSEAVIINFVIIKGAIA